MSNPTVILNRFKRSPLPSNWDIAEALREGRTTLDELAEQYDVKVRTITKRLQVAGWDARGVPIPMWLLEPPADVAVCKRCGRERQIKSGRRADLCQDCRTVEREIAALEKEGAA